MGEINGKSKLTEKEVLEIRAKYNSKNISQRELSRQYKVSQCAINNVVNSKNWAHV
jgi:Mor family transcriptional regulator